MPHSSLRRRLLGLSLCTLLVGLSALAAPQPAPAAPHLNADWRDDVIYLILVDRFADGNHANDYDVDPKNPFAYHGGDLAGVVQKLDYLKDLGVTALWLTPINDNQHVPIDHKYWGYHGYWINDFNQVDRHFGDEATLKRLVAEAHARGIKVLIDCVVNHAGYNAAMPANPKFHDWFHHNGPITDWDDPYQNENYDLAGLPDFNTENHEVLDFMVKSWTGWQKRTGIDGFRVDTVRHVPLAFWTRFNRAVHHAASQGAFTVGEVSYHDPHRLPPYLQQGGFDSVFDFPMFETLRNVFALDKPMTLLADRLKQDSLYSDPRMLSPFLDNHDEIRFLTLAKGDQRKLRLALACLVTLRGIPSLYYGTETGMMGGHDPDNRKDMDFEGAPGLRAYVRHLLAVRKSLPALRRGNLRVDQVDHDTAVYVRGVGASEVIVALNNGDASRTLPVHTWAPGVSGYRDVLGGLKVESRQGAWRVTVPPRGAAILVPEVVRGAR